MKFSEMPYKRPDTDRVIKEYTGLAERVKKAEKAEEVFDAVAEHEKISRAFDTQSSIAYVRSTIDTNNEFYKGERDFYDENSPRLGEPVQNFQLALFSSKFRPELEKKYGKLLFKNMEMSLKTFSPEIVPELQAENRLSSEYQTLIASAKIAFDGKELTLAQMTPYKENPDRGIRHAAYKAEGMFYKSHAEELDRIYDDMVKVRTEAARKLGLKNFTELAYLRRTRNCYSPSDVAVFREGIIKDIVPIVCRLKEKQAERIGIAPSDFKLYDDNCRYMEGNPKPHGTPSDILEAGRKMYTDMSAETAEFIGFMYENELLDVESKPGKAAGGYCTYFSEYKSPFIFSNFNGTSGDVDVLTHEAGHAFAAYQARNFEIDENSQPTMEACEVHSMSMEFLAWKYLNLFYGEDADRARYAHLESALNFLPYGTMVDHFQHIVYDNPEMTPAQRNEKWAELEKIYRPYLDFGDIPFYNEGRGWQRQLHIYQYPFYYIDYCLAQTAALDVWRMSQDDYKGAWEAYTKFVSEGGKRTLAGLCEYSGIANPISEGAVKNVAEKAASWLGGR